MDGQWNDLPHEVQEMVLACLPIQVLCYFRLVCKTWNHLITQPRFASLCVQVPWPTSCILITPKLNHCNVHSKKDHWEILDMKERRFYNLSDSFLDHSLYCRDKDYLDSQFYAKYTLAVDGGLIYVIYSIDNYDIKQEPWQHIVCNPISKDMHHIPAPKFHFAYNHRDIVVMSVDKATQNYKIIIMESYERSASRISRQKEVYLYDSRTTQWRLLCETPNDKWFTYSCIFLKGVFYTLFVDTTMVPWCPKLYSCDIETGAWTYINVDLQQPSHPQDKSQLVVSLGRMFFVEYTGLPMSGNIRTPWESVLARNKPKRKQLIKLVIWEIQLAEKEVVKVVEKPKYSKYERHMLNTTSLIGGNPVVALGCRNSIVISSFDGCNMGFDLLKKCWYEMPSEHKYMYLGSTYVGLVHLDLRKMST